MKVHLCAILLIFIFFVLPVSSFAFADSTTLPWKITIKKTSGVNSTSFLPMELHAKLNDTIQWINNDTTSHTVTSGVLEHPTYVGKIFDSNIINPGESYSLKIPSNVWSGYYYFCKIHPWMTGKIDVGIAYLGVSPDFNISTDKTTYSDDQTIKIAGVVNETLQIMPLTIQIFDNNRNLVYQDKTNLLKDHSFIYKLKASSSIFKITGNYKIKSLYGFPATVADVNINFNGHASSSVKIVPDSSHILHWIKNNAKLWSNNEISNSEFINGLQFLIKKHYITIQTYDSPRINSNVIPIWLKNNSESWANGKISDEEFISDVQYLLTHGIIQV